MKYLIAQMEHVGNILGDCGNLRNEQNLGSFFNN